MWHGIVDLTYSKQDGGTKITNSFTQAPFKIQRPFYPEGNEICHSIVLHTAGGLVGGDLLSQNILLEPDSRSLITTTAASKIYRSNGHQAKQDINIHLHQGSFLEFLPQETIVFNGAVYQQNLRLELAPEANWLGWEITRFGRSARGEKFLQGEWRSYTEVWQEGKPLWIDRQWLPGGEETFYHPHGLGGKPVVGTLSWIGKPVTKEVVTEVRNLWQQKPYQGEAGVTQLLCGLLCRYRGDSTSEVRNWFTEVWQLLRPNYLNKPALKPRVWPM